MKKRNKMQWASALLLAAALAGAAYIMVHGLGLVDGLDFGAGAYYYADIPEFERFVNGDAYRSPVPMWFLSVLFLGWGYLMYCLWRWVDKK